MITPEQFAIEVAKTIFGCYFILLAVIMIIISIIMAIFYPQWSPLG